MADPSRLEALQADLNARKSIFHFAHAAISLLVGSIAAATGGRLFYDSGFLRLPVIGAAAVVAAVMYGHGFIRWGLGNKALQREAAQFAELKELRATLGLDDPNVLLPR